MDEPKVPDDLRNWESINIYLFSNGQQYSPPRKYHFEVDELKSWSATKNYLARSQFGSMHCAIELYSLEGKKVETPLELKNSTTYVAVEPPDAFIAAGYEKYLIKASRSREKRQEKLLIKEQEVKSDDMDIYLDLNKAERNEGIVTLKTITEDPITASNKTIISSPLTNDRKLSSNAKSNIYPITKPYGANTSSITRNTITKKSNLTAPKVNSQVFSNKKNTPVLKNQRRYSNKQRNMSSDNSVLPAAYNGDSFVSKSLLKIDKDQIAVNVKELKSNIQNHMNPAKENMKQLSFSNKDLIAVSNVYKNKNSDESSIIFTETERKATINDNSELPREFSKPNLLTEDLVPNSLEPNKKVSDVPISEPIQNSKDVLNIKVRIKLEDFTSSISESGNHSIEKTSFITLVKKEKASQVSVDVILSKNIFTFNNNLVLKGKSLESCIKLDNEKVLPQNDNANIFIVHCKCNNNIDSKNCISNVSHYNKVESNDVLVMPTTKNGEAEKSFTSDSKKIETHDIEIQNSISSIKIRNQSIVSNYSQDVTKNKVSITQENQSTTNEQSEFQDVQAIKIHDPLAESKVFIDKYVQTEWCNVLLQAKCHEDGRYSFHLPALSLLKYYNMNQMYHIYYLSLTQHFFKLAS